MSKINHYIIIDNYVLGDGLNLIRNIYTQLLDNYYKECEQVTLCYTYPEITIYQIEKHNIYSIFHKIFPNYKLIRKSKSIYYDKLFQQLLKKIDPLKNNEIIAFIAIDKLSDHNIKTLNTLDYQINCQPVLVDVDIHQYTEDRDGKFKNIKLIDANKFLKTPYYTFFKGNIKYNSPKIQHEFISVYDFMDYLQNINLHNELFLKQHDPKELYEHYLEIKSKVKSYIGTIKKGEEQLKFFTIYHRFKKFINLIKVKYFEEYSKYYEKNESENYGKLFLEYAKKANTFYGKFVTSSNQVILSNINKLNKFDKIKPITIPSLHKKHEKQLQQSKEFFNSILTLSDWTEEIEYGGCLGLMLLLKVDGLHKMGFNCDIEIEIEEVTTTLLPITDFIMLAQKEFELYAKKYKNLDNVFGNLNNIIIASGNAIGKSNAVVPLYINKYHWKIAKQLMEPILGIILAHNPLSFKSVHNNFFLSLLNLMNLELFSKNKKFLNERFLRFFLSVIRTYAQICFDNKYQRGIKHFTNNYMLNKMKYNSLSVFLILCDKIIWQLICTGCYIDNDGNKKVINKMLKDYCIIVLKPECIEDCKLSNDVLDYLNNMTLHLFACHKIGIMMNLFYKSYGSFGKYIKKLESNYGYHNDDCICYIIEMIKKIDIPKKITFEILEKEFGLNRSILIDCCTNQI